MFSQQSVLSQRDFCAFDIGAFSVKALACSMASGKLEVRASAKVRHARRDMPQGPFSNPVALAQTLRAATVKLAASLPDGTVPPDAVFTFGHLDFFFDAISFNSVRKDAEVPVTAAEMSTLVRTVEGLSLSRVRSRVAVESRLSETAIQPVTSLINFITLDRRPVARAVGENGRNLKVGFLNAFAPRSSVQVLKRAARSAGLRMVGIVPVGLALAKALDESHHPASASLLLDFGAAFVTVAVVHGQQVRGWAVVPFGYDALERMLTQAGLHPIEAANALAKGIFEGPAAAPFFRFCEHAAKAVAACLESVDRSGAAHAYVAGAAAYPALVDALKTELGTGYASLPFLPLASVCSLVHDAHLDGGWCAVAGAARAGAEMALPVHDPLLRTLRTILYRYE